MITSHLAVIFIEKETQAFVISLDSVVVCSLGSKPSPFLTLCPLPCNFGASSGDVLPLNIGLNLVTCFGQ